MTRARTYISAAAFTLALLLVSCTKEKEMMDNFTGSRTEASLEINGSVILDFDENSRQVGWNPGRKQFRVSDDRMYDYFVITLDRIPEVGGETTGVLEYTTETDIITKKGVKFKLARREGETLWLWSRKSRIGAVVSTIEN